MAFCIDSVRNLGFVKVGSNSSSLLTDEQIQLVEVARRKAKERPEDLIEWDTAKTAVDWDEHDS